MPASYKHVFNRNNTILDRVSVTDAIKTAEGISASKLVLRSVKTPEQAISVKYNKANLV
jgi:hypothetical protein